MKHYFVYLAFLLLLALSSCSGIFRSVFFPNRCVECYVIDTTTGDTLSTHGGCGGYAADAEDNAKISAYDSGICNSYVSCNRWKMDE